MTSRRTTLLTAVLGTGLLAVASAPALAAPSPAAAGTGGADTELTMLCDGVGEDVLTITGDLSTGGSARFEQRGLSVVGSPGFTGTDADGDEVLVEPTGDGVTCTARTTSSAGSLAELLPAAQADQADADGRVEGRLTVTAEVDADAVAAAAPRQDTRSAAAAALPFEAEVRRYLASRPGAVGVAVRLPGTGESWTYTKTSARNVTASIVKVEIMAAVMMRAQDAGRSLTSWERSKIEPMIRTSDNAATTDLFNSLGGRAALDRASDRLGMDATYADTGGRWGLTTTTALDQTTLMEHFARPTGTLSYSNRTYGLRMMRSVSSAQDWGVTAGPPSGQVAVKNGWLPRTDGWHVNSIGWQSYGEADYTIGVLTHDDPGAMSTQISTIEGVSRIVWRNRLALLEATEPEPRGRSGDLDGDGRVDLGSVSAGGYLYVHRGDGSGGFATRRAIKPGLGSYTWFGNAGDVNRDGRSDVLARDGDGVMRLMYSTSSGGLTYAKALRPWFASYTDLAGGYDVDGDGNLDLLGRLPGGEVVRFELTDEGELTKAGSMGSPVRWYPEIDLVGDVNGDGRADLRGRATGGRMRTWTAGASSFATTSATSTGWDRYGLVGSPGDLNGTASRQDDVIAASPYGSAVDLYYGTGSGGTSGPVRTGASLTGMEHLL